MFLPGIFHKLFDSINLDARHPDTDAQRKIRQRILKHNIRHRLMTEDYTCRLPKPPKPRVRYKLQRRLYIVVVNGFCTFAEEVYK